MRLVTATPEGGTGAFMVAVAVSQDGRIHLSPRAPLHATGGSGYHVDLAEFRAAVESEAFAHGVVIPGGPGAKTGQRRVA